jgi:hypothetical protein
MVTVSRLSLSTKALFGDFRFAMNKASSPGQADNDAPIWCHREHVAAESRIPAHYETEIGARKLGLAEDGTKQMHRIVAPPEHFAELNLLLTESRIGLLRWLGFLPWDDR